ncbi:uncharacterized protein LOC106635992 isoform X2 [Copidosoma floridanum]|uniref:uncharacterized protein LOC106635992 isoform X2 n=1 Tax=Copidosoma floridanum TaxID=29053 RepID=UPI0006C99E66|nr:uncharacterized protein LOC106635992 isoform X2 [Copidosoma floridanum]
MSEGSEYKYKWTPESTTLLVSVWTDKQVQKQLEYSSKPQLIWESVARYMNKKGYGVTGKQCRSRMKQVLVCYKEAKKSSTRAGVEQYYESIDKVLKLKRLEQINANCNNNNVGIDTVDSVVNVKSPPKEVKTNKNLQMRFKYQQPAESIYRTEALSPVWSRDSPESSETVLAQPFRVFSPVRDAATNTTQQQLVNTNKKILLHNAVIEEIPIKETYRQSTYSNNYFNDVPFQNTVQNVQNQIIQENMQQNQAILQQNMLQNQVLEQNRLQMNANVLRQNIQNANQGLYADQGVTYCSGQMAQIGLGQQNGMIDNALRIQQNNCQLNSANNRAQPQEPKKNFRQNLAANYRQFQDVNLQNYNPNLNQVGFLSPSISPDLPPNLNDAFYQQKPDKGNVMTEPYAQTASNQLNTANHDITTITNNATFNDDTISIEFLQDSPSPDEEPVKLKDFAVNTEEVPSAPFRKKKAEKLERLMMNAINSQTEVVNKILAAQNDMVSRVLDLDRDRQNRLETRIDHLLDVVQHAVLNKSGNSDQNSADIQPPPSEPVITNLLPPPKPGTQPPKLDLVPPKPCRVPCTASVGTGQPMNTVTMAATRPGVVSPVMSPSRRVGAIWQKLGPVSTSPFVRAQQQLGCKPINAVGNDVRTQSSAERRIVKGFDTGMDMKTLIFETNNFLESERHVQEVVENARLKALMNQDLQSRRRLFTQREPNAAIILTAAFLDAEIQSAEIYESARQNWLRQKQFERQVDARARLAERRYEDNLNNNAKLNNNDEDVLLSGQGDSYERLKQLNGGRDKLLGDSRDSSTPAKPVSVPRRDLVETNEPRQTIQQLAQLVMNSARWRNAAGENHTIHRKDLNLRTGIGNVQKSSCPNYDPVTLRNNPKETELDNREHFANKQEVDGKIKTLEWLQERYSYGGQPTSDTYNAVAKDIASRRSYNQPPKPPRTMGFTTELLYAENNNDVPRRQQIQGDLEKRVGFVFDNALNKDNFTHDSNDPLEELRHFYIQKQMKLQPGQSLPFILQNGQVLLPQSDVIEHYVQESKAKLNKDTDSDNDEEFLDTTMSMQSSRKNSLTNIGSKQNCIIS